MGFLEILDIRTLTVLILFISIISGLTLLLLAKWLRIARGLKRWSMGFFVITSGFLLLGLQCRAHPFISVILANFLILLSLYFLHWGYNAFFGQSNPWRWHLPIWIIQLVGFSIFTLFTDLVGIRIILISFWSVYGYALVAVFMVIYARGRLRIISHISASFYGALAVAHLWRGFATVQAPPDDLFLPDWVTGLIFLVLIFSIFGWTLSALLLTTGQSQVDLENSVQQLQDANASKTKILSIIGHDLKNPIFNIKLSLELMMENRISKKDSEELTGQLLSSTDQSLFLLENLLDWGKTQMEQNYKNTVPLGPILESLGELFRATARRKGIELSFQEDDPPHVLGHYHGLQAILRNIISNSMKYTLEGGHIRIYWSATTDHLTIVVQDNGMGISPDRLAKINQGKTMLSQKGTSGEMGSGLGLKLTQELVDLMKGEMELQSEEGVGTTAHLKLPLGNEET
jgi:signal transduction histidine kinase